MNNNNNNDNGIRTPGKDEQNLFRGIVSNPQPGKNWLIIIFDGTQVVSASCWGYSLVWGIYITREVKNEELEVSRRIKESPQVDPQDLKDYVAYSNCPPLNIEYPDWVESAGKTIKKVINLLSPPADYSILVLSNNPSWSRENRIIDIYKSLGLTPSVTLDSYLVSEIEEKGKERIAESTVVVEPTIDADYYLYSIKKENNKYREFKVRIFEKGKPLELKKNSRKNKSSAFIVEPFSKETHSHRYDLVLSKEKGNTHTPVSLARISTTKMPLKFYATFEPVEDIPQWVVPGVIDIEPIKNVESLSEEILSIRVKSEPKPIKALALIDATMKEELLEPAKERLIEMFKTISKKNKNAEFGLVVYGDYSERDRKAEFEVKSIPKAFLPIDKWVEMCKKEVTYSEARDFMSSLDMGLSRAEDFQWDEEADKYLVLIFRNPPHPKHEPKRKFYVNYRYKKAREDWRSLLQKLHRRKIKILSICLTKKMTGQYAKHIEREVDITCKIIGDTGFLGKGIEKIDEIESLILGDTVIQHIIEPDNYQMPIILEEVDE